MEAFYLDLPLVGPALYCAAAWLGAGLNPPSSGWVHPSWSRTLLRQSEVIPFSTTVIDNKPPRPPLTG